MANPDRDNLYSEKANRTIYTRESNGTGWFVGIIVVLALLAIGYLVFSANSNPATTTGVEINNTPAIEAPATPVAPTPMTDAASTTDAAPMTPAAPTTDAAPATDSAAPAETAPAEPATSPAQ